MNITSIVIIFIIGVAVGAVGMFYGKNFIQMDKNEAIKMLENWAVWAVAKAEKELGSATGELKLAKVYNEFITECPEIAKVVCHDEFRALITFTLARFQKLVETNDAVAMYMNGTNPFLEDYNEEEMGE